MTPVRLFAILTAFFTLSCRAPAETPRTAASTPPAQPRRPNIVFVLVDDMRWDDLRVGGHPFIETPHMDRLASEGARFTNAFATTPLCSPSRASFLTGQYPHTNGIIDNTARPSHDLPVFPKELQRAGYRTGFFGKWHMGNDSPRPGFDHWVAMPGDTVFPRIRNMGYAAVRTSRHKYIRYRELKGMDELYDLEADPHELANLIAKPEARETLERMQAELQRVLDETK